MPLRLNTKQLAELIESIEAGGGDASLLRRELEEWRPEPRRAPPPRRRGYRVGVEEEEETTEERLNRKVGDLFPEGITDVLLHKIIEMDRNHSLAELRMMCQEHGLGAGGEKKELAAKLIAGGVPGTKLPQTQPMGTCYEDAWRFVIREGEGELVHGSVQTIGKRIDHAWVETETGYIWEPESGEFMKKAPFYERAEPKVEARYTATQAAILAARTNHFGPWTKEKEQKWIRST